MNGEREAPDEGALGSSTEDGIGPDATSELEPSLLLRGHGFVSCWLVDWRGLQQVDGEATRFAAVRTVGRIAGAAVEGIEELADGEHELVCRGLPFLGFLRAGLGLLLFCRLSRRLAPSGLAFWHSSNNSTNVLFLSSGEVLRLFEDRVRRPPCLLDDRELESATCELDRSAADAQPDLRLSLLVQECS
jgi:hypothetical protein